MGYQIGKYWVPDTLYERCTQFPSYNRLLQAARSVGLSLFCEYSSYSKAYTAETKEVRKTANGQHLLFARELATDPQPVFALTKAVRKDDKTDLLCSILCIELDLVVLSSQIKAEASSENKLVGALEDLASAIRGIRQ